MMWRTTMQQYKHRPLDTNSNEIRLIRVQKSIDEGAPIVLTVKHVTLEKAWAFDALSYMWGEENPSFVLYIQDATRSGYLHVRENLYSFLFLASHSKEDWSSQWFWIDQLCINQSYHMERTHQVNQMARLYATARTTVIWPLDRPITKPCTDPARVRRIDPLEIAIADIMISPYWWRLWVIQEIVLAADVKIIMQGHAWSLHHFWNILSSEHIPCWLVGTKWDEVEDRISSFIHYRHLRASAGPTKGSTVEHGTRSNSWSDVLELCADAQCTLPLDRIYGVMGLLVEELRIPADYDVSQKDLLEKIVQKQISFNREKPADMWVALYALLRSWRSHVKWEEAFPVDDSWGELRKVMREEDSQLRRMSVEHYVRLILRKARIPIPADLSVETKGVVIQPTVTKRRASMDTELRQIIKISAEQYPLNDYFDDLDDESEVEEERGWSSRTITNISSRLSRPSVFRLSANRIITDISSWLLESRLFRLLAAYDVLYLRKEALNTLDTPVKAATDALTSFAVPKAPEARPSLVRYERGRGYLDTSGRWRPVPLT